MATLRQLYDAVIAELEAATTGLTINAVPVQIKVASDWPSKRVFEDLIQNGGARVSVFNRGGRNVTRWMPRMLSQTKVEPQVESAVSDTVIQPLGQVTITLSGAAQVNDAVSAVMHRKGIDAAAVAKLGTGETLSDLAAALAAAINAEETLSEWVTALSAAQVVTITNLGDEEIKIESYVGNIYTQKFELQRVNKHLQITVWTRTQQERDIVTEPIIQRIARLQRDGYLSLADGTRARIVYVDDMPFDDDVWKDLYCHHILVDAEYSITEEDVAYAVIAPVLTKEF